jgi:diguanylate cyclase (GGDEF)-like protein
MEDNRGHNVEDELYRLRLMVPQLKLMTEEYKRSERKLRALYEISELSSQTQNLADLYPEIHRVVDTLINAENFYISLWDKQKDLVEIVYFVDPYDDFADQTFSFKDIENGITGYMLQKGSAVLLSGEQIEQLTDSGDIEIRGAKPIDWVGAPLFRDDEIIGAVAVQSYSSNVRYSNHDRELLNFVAQHIVAAIERVKQQNLLHTQIEEGTNKLAETTSHLEVEKEQRVSAENIQGALLEIAEYANSESDISRLYKHIHELIGQFINAENYYIALLDPTEQKLTFPYYVDEFNSEIEDRDLGNGLTEYVIRQGKAFLLATQDIEALESDEQIDVVASLNTGKRALYWLGCPLKVAGEVIGVINVQSYREDIVFNEHDLQLLKFASHHIALAISHKLSAENMVVNQSKLEEKIQQRTKDLQCTNDLLLEQIEERKRVEKKLFHDAHHDALTGLPNRLMFQDSIKRAVAHKKRDLSSRYAVLFIDLDRFKLINDTLGHHAGDEFLVEVSQRIQTCIRDQDLLARLGGDEFVILLNAFDSEYDCEEIAGRIIEQVSRPFEVDNQNVYSGASIGVALINSHYADEEEVMRDADAAMYHAKAMGKGRFVLFDPSMHEKLVEEMETERQLRQAIINDEIELYFQPISQLANGEVVGFESLMRWNHPERGLLEPESFIKTAEDTGLIIKLDMMAIERACQLLRQWQYNGGEQKYYNLHVNISNIHLSQPRLIKDIIRVIKESAVVPYNLILEVDETGLSKNADEAFSGLKALKKIGVKLALDNFGSGLASLNYLYNYPFDFVKIDRRYVRTMTHSSKHFMLIMSAQSVANHVGFKLIAQGIENAKQVEQLKELHCDFGQGHFIGSPKKLVRLDSSEDSMKSA